MMKHGVAAAALAALLLAESGPAGAQAQTQTFTSGSATIRVEWFKPARPSGSAPAILFLHGADGLAFGERYRSGARSLAAAGYHVFLPHYFDRTGGRPPSFSAIPQNFPAWTDTVRDAIGWALRQPGVEPGRVGLLGVSLGGGLSLASAARDGRVKAVVEYFGFWPQGLAPARPLPPVLILHGTADPVVPVANAQVIESALKRLGSPYEIKLYPGQGHGFSGAAQSDAAVRAVTFFNRHLKGAAGPA